jgi:hypothetical protein
MKQLILFLFFSLPFLNISQVFRENYRTTKLEICDAKDNLIFVTDTTDIDLLVTNDSLILSNRETKHNSIYVFGSILKNTKKVRTWTSKNPLETGVIVFYLQEKEENQYVFYIFFENVTYRYYCVEI